MAMGLCFGKVVNMHDWKLYKRRGYTEARPYVPGEDLTGVGIPAGVTPVEGGVIARDPSNPNDRWYVTRDLFWATFEAPNTGYCPGIKPSDVGGQPL